MKYRGSQYRFRPTLGVSFMTAVGLLFFVMMGCWQWHRGDEKTQWLKEFNLRQTQPPHDFAEINVVNNPRFTKVKAEGYFDNTHSFLLDNRFHQHQFGYEIITPFKPNHASVWLLVNRGWLKGSVNRQELPNFPVAAGLQTINGIISIPSSFSLVLGMEEQTKIWPKRIMKLDIPLMSRVLNKPLAPYILLLDPKLPQGFIRNWVIAVTPPEKNYAYAVQWFLFGLILLGIFIVFQFKRMEAVS